jgi:cell division protease FtsH
MANGNSPEGKNSNPNQPKGGPPPANKYSRSLITWVLIIMLIMMMTLMFNDKGGDLIDFDEFVELVKNGDVKEVTIYSEHLTGVLTDEALDSGRPSGSSKNFKVNITPGLGKEQWFNAILLEYDLKYNNKPPSLFIQILPQIIIWVVLLGLIYFFVFRQFRGMGGGGMLGSFGRSRHRVSTKDQLKITFEQVAGINEAKEEVQEIIQFLRSPKKFQRLGGRVPRGVLLVGEPGCGKTLLAKAIAGEADVPFFSISGSDFVEMFVGVGASRVRDLFKQAKDNSPCIIFLDEIDAVGRKRGSGVAGGGNDEREQTLNAILVEMDGFSTNDQVIVIAATNRADVLDNALTRTGRFDRQIYVPLPDVKGRYGILTVHAKKVKLGPDTDLERLAKATPMFSGADLEAIINEAALAATMSGKDSVEMVDLEEARDKVRWGRANRSREVDEKDRLLTAYHEAGHALVQSVLDDTDPVHKVSIIPRGQAGGATFSLPEKDRYYYTRKYCLANIRVIFGGRIAEELFCGDISSGAQSDISQATGFARKMVMEWGMSDKVGFIHYGPEQTGGRYGEYSFSPEISDRTAENIDSEIKAIMDQAYADTKAIIQKYKNEMEALKDALLKYETLDGDEVKKIIAGELLNKPSVADLLEAEKQRTAPPPPKQPDPEPQNGPDTIINPIPKPGLG